MIHFHRVLISTAILFCLGFAAWTFTEWRTSSSGGELALSIVFLCAGGLLGYYLKHLNRFLHR